MNKKILGYLEREFPGASIKLGPKEGAADAFEINEAGKLYTLKVSYLFMSPKDDLDAKLSEFKVAEVLRKAPSSSVTLLSDGLKLD